MAADGTAPPAIHLHSLAAFQKPGQHEFAVRMKRLTDLIDGVGSTGCQPSSEGGEQETGQVKRDWGHGKASRCGAYNQSCNTSESTVQGINKKPSPFYIPLELQVSNPVRILVQINFLLFMDQSSSRNCVQLILYIKRAKMRKRTVRESQKHQHISRRGENKSYVSVFPIS